MDELSWKNSVGYEANKNNFKCTLSMIYTFKSFVYFMTEKEAPSFRRTPDNVTMYKIPVSGDESPASLDCRGFPSLGLFFTGVCLLIFTVAFAHIIRLVVFRLDSVLSSKPPGGIFFQQRASALPLRRAKLANCVSSCVLSMALDSADSPTADCGRPYEGRFPHAGSSRRAGPRPVPETRCPTAPRTAR